MKRFVASALALVLVLSLALFPGCKDNSEEIQKEFDGYIAALPQKMLSSDDMNLNYLFYDKETYGFEDSLYTLPYSDSSDYQATKDKGMAMIKELESFSYNKLREDQQLTRDILLDYLKRTDKVLQYYYLDNSYLGSFIGFQAQLPLLLEQYNFYDKEDLESYFNILKTSPVYFKKYADIEKERQVRQVGMSQTILDKVIEQCNNFTAEKRPFLIEVINEKLDTLSFLNEAEKAEAKKKNEELLTTCLIEAYAILEKELVAIQGNTNDLGLASMPNGKEYYEALLQQSVGTDMTVPEVKDYLKDQIDKYTKDFAGLAAKYPQAMAQLLEGEELVYCDFSSAEENLDYLQKKMLADYPEIDNLNYQIHKVADSMKDNFSPAAYLQGRIDAPADAPEMIYINGEYESSLFNTIAHEGYPGHMYQHAYFRSTKPAVARMLIDYNGYSEGWATYVENNAWKYAQGTEEELALLAMAQTNQRIVQMIICQCDIGLHYDGWDRERFGQELKKNFGDSLSEEDINEQYNLNLETPTNYLQYYFSGAKMQDMYDYAKKALGERFEPVVFHKVLLETGPSPLTILEKQVERYVERTKNDTVEEQQNASDAMAA